MSELQDFLTSKAAELGVVGAMAGVLVDGREHAAFFGVTSVENPLEVDASTLFQFGSTGKTFTATALMRLVSQGKVDLDAPVKRYLPDLRLKDSDVADRVTVLQLLNHTAGWQGDAMTDTGDGDDCLERFMITMADLDQVEPLGSTVSYNNASLSLAGHLIATVTGQVYEKAMKELVLDPLELSMTFFRPDDIMTRRFACGHTVSDDGRVTVSRPWSIPRSSAPAGGMSATVGDQLSWARFHLGDGTAPDGRRILPSELMRRMQEPTVEMPGSALGDAVGISWLIKDVDGNRLVSHGGTTFGQYSDFTLVPSRGFAVTCLSNSGPNGPQLDDALTEWALEHYLGIKQAKLVPEDRSDEELTPYAGRYEIVAYLLDVQPSQGALVATLTYQPGTLHAMRESGQEVDDQPPFRLGLVPGGDRYVVVGGSADGMRGFFTRDDSGRVDGLHLGGRMAARVAVPV